MGFTKQVLTATAFNGSQMCWEGDRVSPLEGYWVDTIWQL